VDEESFLQLSIQRSATTPAGFPQAILIEQHRRLSAVLKTGKIAKYICTNANEQSYRQLGSSLRIPVGRSAPQLGLRRAAVGN
jgi:hypothetical protein